MMTDTFLARTEIHSLTNKIKRPAQVKVLNSMGIEHKIRPDGSVAILRAHITKVFGGTPDTVRKPPKTAEPNWSAI